MQYLQCHNYQLHLLHRQLLLPQLHLSRHLPRRLLHIRRQLLQVQLQVSPLLPLGHQLLPVQPRHSRLPAQLLLSHHLPSPVLPLHQLHLPLLLMPPILPHMPVQLNILFHMRCILLLLFKHM